MGRQSYIEGEHKVCTLEEYFLFEDSSLEKHEWRNGEVFAMAGSTPNHNTIATNAHGSLKSKLKGKNCKPFAMDIKLFHNFRLTYPDVFVVCGDWKFYNDRKDTPTNATLIIEVLSNSTEAYDRGEKFEHYKKMQGLKEYVLISQHEKLIEVFFKLDENIWRCDYYRNDDDVVLLRSLELEIPLLDFYEDVVW